MASSEGLTVPEATQNDSPNSTVPEPAPRAERSKLRRLAVNLVLLFLCVLAVATFLAVHVSLTGGVIGAIVGSALVGAFPNFLKWALKRYEEEIQKQALDSLESSRLSRWLSVTVAVLVLLNLIILPQEGRARIDAMWNGQPIELRIVPVGNLYFTLASLRDRDDANFDLSVHRIARQGKSQSDKFYRLEKMGPGITYTGAAVKDLTYEHAARSHEEVEQLASQLLPASDAQSNGKPKLDSDTYDMKEDWRKFQYLGTDVFRQDDKIEIEIRCVSLPGSKVNGATFTKIAVLLRDFPIQTVPLNAKPESNPCVPPH
jgi:multisubunit Na+/H+ antiporter MnhB subunit